MRKNRLICIALIISVVLSLSGCIQTPGYAPTETTDYSSLLGELFSLLTETTESLTTPASTPSPATRAAQTTQTSLTVPQTEQPTETAPTFFETEQSTQTLPEPIATDPTPPEFYDLVSLSGYLNSMKESDIIDIRFRYSGVDSFDASMIARMTNACYISYYEENGLYELHLTEYPGDRIVDAWRLSDTSFLSEDELLTFNTAAEIVSRAAEIAQTPLELEIFLHDYLVETITYYDDTRDVSDPMNPPRNLSAVGALLDGYANCQGYTDAFYVLASMAGFTVSRMSVYTPSDLHSVNTICIDGNWYVVDVTFDDCDNEGSNYRLLNAGTDVINEYAWHDYNQFYPISAQSDGNYYYNCYGLVYSDVNTLAFDIALSYASGDETVFHAMVTDHDNSDEFNSALYDALMEYGIDFNYTYWYNFTGEDTVYTVYFE